MNKFMRTYTQFILVINENLNIKNNKLKENVTIRIRIRCSLIETIRSDESTTTSESSSEDEQKQEKN